jgi:hypothetical protein
MGRGQQGIGMPERIQISPRNGYLQITVSGLFNYRNALAFTRQLATAATQTRISQALVDIRGMEGNLSVMTLHSLGDYAGKALPLAVKMAVLTSRGKEADYKVYEDVAVDRGAQVRVVTSLSEAMQWLGIAGHDAPESGIESPALPGAE